MVVPAKSPIKSMADVVQAAKNAPGGLDVTTPGIGTVSHLTAELFQRSAGIKLLHIPSRAANSALMDVVAGRIPVMLSSIPTALGTIQSGQLRAIAVSALERSGSSAAFSEKLRADNAKWSKVIKDAGLRVD